MPPNTHTDARIALQLAHAGRKGSTTLLWEGDTQPLEKDNWGLIGSSPIPYSEVNQTPAEMSREDMAAVVADFVRSTEMAEEAGFDMLELHMAHGYLLSTFLSPLINVRNDD